MHFAVPQPQDKAVLPQGLSQHHRPCFQQGATVTAGLATGNENTARFTSPQVSDAPPAPSAPPKLLGLKEGSGHERDDKAYHYSRLWIIAGLKWTEVIDFTGIIESIQWDPGD